MNRAEQAINYALKVSPRSVFVNSTKAHYERFGTLTEKQIVALFNILPPLEFWKKKIEEVRDKMRPEVYARLMDCETEESFKEEFRRNFRVRNSFARTLDEIRLENDRYDEYYEHSPYGSDYYD